jgi:tRNA pseudouridine synthase 10
MSETAWRKRRLADVLARPDVRAALASALAAGPLCDHCLGRLVAGADTGLGNDDRGRAARSALAAPARQGDAPPTGGQAVASPAPPAACSLCGGLFAALEVWTARAREALRGLEFDTLAVASHADPAVAAREQALWLRLGAGASPLRERSEKVSGTLRLKVPDTFSDPAAGWDAAGGLAEPYKQEFNRLLGIRLCMRLGCDTDLKDPDVIVVADHAAGRVEVCSEPLFACGRYRKLVRGLPQCRWRQWPTSIQQIVGSPVCREAGGQDHLFHGCGREDVDVRCLGERPFVVEVLRPQRRRLDWAALAQQINASGRVEVLGLARCRRAEVARLKTLRPEKSYRALVRLAAAVDDARLALLAGLVGPVAQRTPARVLKRRPDLLRTRRVLSLSWRRTDALIRGGSGDPPRESRGGSPDPARESRGGSPDPARESRGGSPDPARESRGGSPDPPRCVLELEVRTQAGLYIKELVSGDGGRTRPSVAEVLGVPAECAALDVIAVHL